MKEKIVSDENKRNLLYFESDSMKGLYETIEEWQQCNQKRILSTNIQKDNGIFCCIALSNPSEVIICCGNGKNQADVTAGMLNTR